MRDGLAITLTVVFVDRARKSAVTLPAGFFSAYEKPLPKTESGLRELGAKDTDNPMILLKQRVDAQFMRIDCRREVDGDCNGYWNGQYEAYETVQLMIREYI